MYVYIYIYIGIKHMYIYIYIYIYVYSNHWRDQIAIYVKFGFKQVSVFEITIEHQTGR